MSDSVGVAADSISKRIRRERTALLMEVVLSAHLTDERIACAAANSGGGGDGSALLIRYGKSVQIIGVKTRRSGAYHRGKLPEMKHANGIPERNKCCRSQ